VIRNHPPKHRFATATELVRAVELRESFAQPRRHVPQDVRDHEMCVLVKDDAHPVDIAFGHDGNVVRVLTSNERPRARYGLPLVQRLERGKGHGPTEGR
jgi:hypothetical protein